MLVSTSTAPTVGGDTGLVATLTTTAGVPVPDHSVLFRLTPASGPPVVVARVTGAGGKARSGSSRSPADSRSDRVRTRWGRPSGPNAALGFAVPDDAIYAPSSTALGGPFTFTRKVLFTSTRSGNGDIYVIDPAGGTPVPLASHAAIDAEPEWSPSGDKIAFSSTRAGNADIFVMDSDGTDVTQLTTSSATDTSAAWSPNGRDRALEQPRVRW